MGYNKVNFKRAKCPRWKRSLTGISWKVSLWEVTSEMSFEGEDREIRILSSYQRFSFHNLES